MDDALKPCPFCGGEARLLEWPDIGFVPEGEEPEPSTWFVDCSGCEGGHPPRYDREEAIAAWNRRAPERNPDNG